MTIPVESWQFYNFCKWNHMINSLLWLATFVEHCFVGGINIIAYSSLSLLYSITLCEYTKYLSFLLLRVSCIGFSCLLQTVLLWTFGYMSLAGHSVLLAVILGVRLLVHRVCAYSAWAETNDEVPNSCAKQ